MFFHCNDLISIHFIHVHYIWVCDFKIKLNMDVLNDTLSLLIRNMLSIWKIDGQQSGGELIEENEPIEKFHDERTLPDEIMGAKRDITNAVKKFNDTCSSNIIYSFYINNLRTMFDMLLDEEPFDQKLYEMFLKYIKHLPKLNSNQYDVEKYVDPIDMRYCNLNKYEIANYVSFLLIHYFKNGMTISELMNYYEQLFNVKNLSLLTLEMCVNTNIDDSFSAVVYKTFVEFSNSNKGADYVDVMYTQFEKLFEWLLDNETSNLCVMSAYLISYVNASGKNGVTEHINKTYDYMFPCYSNETPNAIILCKNFVELNMSYDINNEILENLLRNKFARRINDVNQSIIRNPAIRNTKPMGFIQKFLRNRKPLCLILPYLESFDYMMVHIRDVLWLYEQYYTRSTIKEFIDTLCNINWTNNTIYEHDVIVNEKRTASHEYIYRVFHDYDYSLYRNFRITGLYKSYDFDQRNTNNVTILEEMMIELLNNKGSVFHNITDVIYSMKRLLDKNNCDDTIINTYINTSLGSTDSNYMTLVHMLNRMSQLYSHDEIHNTLEIQYDDVLSNTQYKKDKANILVLYYLVKYDVIQYPEISKITDILYLMLVNIRNGYEYKNTHPHYAKYKLDETIEHNFGVKTIKRLIDKMYLMFPPDEVNESLEKITMLHGIASFTCSGDDNTEFIDIGIEIIDTMLDNGFDINTQVVYKTAIYFATNNKMIEYLMLKRIDYDIDIFNIAFGLVGEFYFYEKMFEDIFRVSYKTYIDQQFTENEDRMIEYFHDQIDDSFIYSDQLNMEKYERYGILQRIVEKLGKFENHMFDPLCMLSTMDIISTPLILNERIFKIDRFESFKRSTCYEKYIKQWSTYAILRTTKEFHINTYLQYLMVAEDIMNDELTSQLPESQLQQYRIIDKKIRDKYFKCESDEFLLLSDLAYAINIGSVDTYITENIDKLTQYIQYRYIDEKYSVYLTKYGFDKTYDDKSIMYLNELQFENPEYYQIVDFWIFGDYADFNVKLQKHQSLLTYTELNKLGNTSDYNDFYKSVVLSEIIYNAPKPPHKLITFRGVRNEQSMPRVRYPIGSNVVFTRFTSVTPNFDASLIFANGIPENVMKIIIPKDAVCINLVTTENEIVLPRYSVLRYIGDDTLIYIGYNLSPLNDTDKLSLISEDFVNVENQLRNLSGSPVKVTIDAMDLKTLKGMNEASATNDIASLNEWLNSGQRIVYTTNAIDDASSRGNVNVLEWWKNSGLKLKYTEQTMDYASINGHLDVLEWWKNSGLELKYTTYGMNVIGKIDVLEWWKNSGLKLKYNKVAMYVASMNSDFDVLEWWKNSGLELKYSKSIMRDASIRMKFDVLNWWKNSGLKLKIQPIILEIVKYELSDAEYNEVEKWWLDSGLLTLTPTTTTIPTDQ